MLVDIRHNPLSGGYCGGVSPLPIPNREVKPTCADGTAMQCGRVGSRLLLNRSLEDSNIFRGFFVFVPLELQDNNCYVVTLVNQMFLLIILD